MFSLLASSSVQLVIVVLTGLVLGSFATALAWRVPRGLNWVNGRSKCTGCGAVLGGIDLVPLLSWLAFRGRCRHCGAAIGMRYVLIELGVLAACIGLYIAWGFSAPAFIMMMMIPFLAASLVIDIDSMVLPDQLTLAAAIAAAVFLAYSGFQDGTADDFMNIILSRAGAAILFAGVTWGIGTGMTWFLKKEALGFGDVKLMGTAGLWLGVSYLPIFFILAGIIGILWGAVWRFLYKEPLFPFGPALILALYICLILQGISFSYSTAL
jgi:prepilin signal peptidase PulO-like enzyme (type II secretory pathway)